MKISASSFRTQAIKQALFCSVLFIFFAHAFCFLNLTYSGSSAMLHVSSGRSAQLADGLFLQPVYWRIRGSISAPLVVGLLSTVYLSLTAAAAVFLLRLESLLSIVLFCGAMTVNASVTSICASSLHTADAAFLAMLLAACSATCCLRLRFGALPGMLLLAAALGLSQDAAAFCAGLSLLALLSDLLLEQAPSGFFKKGLSVLAALLGGVLIAQLASALMQMRAGQEIRSILTLPQDGLLSVWLAPIQALFAPLNAYKALNIILHALLLILLAALLIQRARSLPVSVLAPLALGVALLPLACNLSAFFCKGAAQVSPAYYLLDACAIVLLFRLPVSRVWMRRFAAGAFSILFLGSIVFSNQIYLKKNLEFESTLSFMTRIIDRIEETPGFRPGYTPVAIIGTPQDSALMKEKKGFEHLAALEAASAHAAVDDSEDMVWYCWEILGYPLNFVSTFDLEQLYDHPQVQALPAYPQEGCCTFIDETLVIRLS